MTEEREPFRLEDEADPPARRITPPPSPEPDELVEIDLERDLEPEPRAPGGSPADAGRSGRRLTRSGEDEPEVDTRTVAERRGDAVEVVSGRRPPPEGWPGEALVYPGRGPGKAVVFGSVLVWVLLDLVTRVNLFAGLFAKMILLVFYVRWFLHAASQTAGGQDRPPRWSSAMEMDREQIAGVGRILLHAVILGAPGAITWALTDGLLGPALLLAGSLWLAAVALGVAVGDPGIGRPWRAVAWLARYPLALGFVAASFWATGLVEWVVAARPGDTFVAALAIFVALRLVFTWFWMMAARALGVVGRAWSPFRD